MPANASLSCSACQRGCHDDQYCNSYRWGSSAWTVYTAACRCDTSQTKEVEGLVVQKRGGGQGDRELSGQLGFFQR